MSYGISQTLFTDTHSHIHAEEFTDISEVIQRAREAGIHRQILVGCSPDDSEMALAVMQKNPDEKFFVTLGVHPHEANLYTPEVEARFREIMKANPGKIVGIGEIGLDYFRNLQPVMMQQDAFRKQLALAREFKLPAVIHARDAWEDILRILQEEGNDRVLMHCFSGDVSVAEECWKRGYLTSISGVVTYPKNKYLQEVVKAAPYDKIVMETDCPYLPPQKFRGQRNEPAYLAHTAEFVAGIWGITMEELSSVTEENVRKFFRI